MVTDRWSTIALPFLEWLADWEDDARVRRRVEGHPDVYVFENTEGRFECMWCRLRPDAPLEPGAGSTFVDTPGGMVAHLREHRAAGHAVPDECIAELEAEAAGEVGW